MAGAAVAVAGWHALRPSLSTPLFFRENYCGRSVPTAGGIVVALVVVAVEAVAVLARAAGLEGEGLTVGPRRAIVLVVVGLGLLGLLDDAAGDHEAAGFRGHLGALLGGHPTTGTVKLFGGGAVAVIAVGTLGDPTFWRVVADAALVALAANLVNLLDRAPGRAIKFSVLALGGLLLAVGVPSELAGVAVAVGAGIGLLVPDLRERLMLGDTGANILGGVLGMGVVVSTSPATRNWVLVALVALNLVSEVVSFSRVIDAVAPLRWLDRLGRAARPPGGSAP